MGCNCGKNKKPLGTKAPTPPPDPKGSTKTTQTFALDTPDGATQTFGSRLEAEAARVRAGRVGTIR